MPILVYLGAMNIRSLFFRLFPPPQLLLTPHAGLEISDDAIRFIEYRHTSTGTTIGSFDTHALPQGLVNGGDIQDEKELIKLLSEFAGTHHISRVKVSLPEEKAYLFQTDVPTTDFRSIAANIESKLDQNVPLSAPDALFQFDLMPRAVTGDLLRASVSVVPHTYIDRMMRVLHGAYMIPVAFEIVPKAIVTAYVPPGTQGTHLIVHLMKDKTGLYIVSEGVVCFTSTVAYGSDKLSADSPDLAALMTEIDKVHSYWVGRGDMHGGISEVIVVGARAEECEALFRAQGGDVVSSTRLPNLWANAFEVDSYVPPISRTESYAYAVAAGLAI